MGEGVLHSLSAKQSINTKSSTETEIVGVSDYLPYAIWLLYFMKEQGYDVKKKYLMQDNQSTIRILKNGKRSAKKQSRHLNIRFFWISDRLSKAHMDCEIQFCPTGLMLGDFFTKPLQGSLFRKMRDVVQGHMSIEHLKPEVLEEDLGTTVDEKPETANAVDDIKSILIDKKERVAKLNEVKFSESCTIKNKNRTKSNVRNYMKTKYPTYKTALLNGLTPN